MLGWLSEASSFASRSKRASRSGSDGEGLGQQLDRDLAPELRVGGAVHLAHAARADRGGDPVVRERLADQGRAPPDLSEGTNGVGLGEAGWPVDSTAARRPASYGAAGAEARAGHAVPAGGLGGVQGAVRALDQVRDRARPRPSRRPATPALIVTRASSSEEGRSTEAAPPGAAGARPGRGPPRPAPTPGTPGTPRLRSARESRRGAGACRASRSPPGRGIGPRRRGRSVSLNSLKWSMSMRMRDSGVRLRTARRQAFSSISSIERRLGTPVRPSSRATRLRVRLASSRSALAWSRSAYRRPFSTTRESCPATRVSSSTWCSE